MTTSDVLRSRKARWLVPAGVLAVIVAGVGVSAGVAGADPALPSRTAGELLASLATADAQPFSGTVEESADLGIPALPGAASTSLSWQSFITGSHTARVWYASPRQVRVSLVGDLAESDLVRDGRDLWVWSSRENTVTHAVLPAYDAKTPPTTPAIDPKSVAERALAAVDPTTAVTVDGTSRVAGRPVYELVVAPRSADSLVGQVRLAIDSETSLPLRVQVIARGASEPAFETAFTSISFGTPDDSVFAFTPPAGAEVTQVEVPATGPRPDRAAAPGTSRPAASATRPTVIGSGWTTVVEIPDASGLLTGTSKASGSQATTDGLLRATTSVSGSFGTGRLLETSLVTVLLLDDGRAFVGAVTPALLERVAGSATR